MRAVLSLAEKVTPLDAAVIDKLEKAVSGGDVVLLPRAELDALRARAGAPPSTEAEFSADDLKVLAELIRVWRGVSALGVLYGFARNLLYFVAGIAAIALFFRGKMTLPELWKAVFG